MRISRQGWTVSGRRSERTRRSLRSFLSHGPTGLLSCGPSASLLTFSNVNVCSFLAEGAATSKRGQGETAGVADGRKRLVAIRHNNRKSGWGEEFSQRRKGAEDARRKRVARGDASRSTIRIKMCWRLMIFLSYSYSYSCSYSH